MDFIIKLIFRPGDFFDEIYKRSNYWRFVDVTLLLNAFLLSLIIAITDFAIQFEPSLIAFVGLTVVTLLLIWFFLKFVIVMMILLMGKILRGKASKEQIITVLSVGLIPNVVLLMYELVFRLVSNNIVDEYNPPYIISAIIWLISIRILIVGLSKAQKFSYGMAILNIFLLVLFVEIGYFIFAY